MELKSFNQSINYTLNNHQQKHTKSSLIDQSINHRLEILMQMETYLLGHVVLFGSLAWHKRTKPWLLADDEFRDNSV